MELPTYFTDFLREIRPTANQRDQARDSVRVLRERLLADDVLSPFIVSTFLQGSYRRATAVRPLGGRRSDVDLVVVTRLDRHEHPPERVIEIVVPFVERWYEGKYEINDRSIGISLSQVDLDLVMTSAPSESQEGILASEAVMSEETPEDEEASDWRLSEAWVMPDHRSGWQASAQLQKAVSEPQWKTEPLYIPSRDLADWSATDPLAQIRWTWEKNRACNGHYVKVVKALKWWRRLNPEPKYPKGYPVEHLVGVCCPDGIRSVADGVVRVLEAIRDDYAAEAADERVPELSDHGLPEHNTMGRVSGVDFAAFHRLVAEAAMLARAAYDAPTRRESACKWRELFGDRFPDAGPDDGDDGGAGGGPKGGGFTSRTGPSRIGSGRFA